MQKLSKVLRDFEINAWGTCLRKCGENDLLRTKVPHFLGTAKLVVVCSILSLITFFDNSHCLSLQMNEILDSI